MDSHGCLESDRTCDGEADVFHGSNAEVCWLLFMLMEIWKFAIFSLYPIFVPIEKSISVQTMKYPLMHDSSFSSHITNRPNRNLTSFLRKNNPFLFKIFQGDFPDRENETQLLEPNTISSNSAILNCATMTDFLESATSTSNNHETFAVNWSVQNLQKHNWYLLVERIVSYKGNLLTYRLYFFNRVQNKFLSRNKIEYIFSCSFVQRGYLYRKLWRIT